MARIVKGWTLSGDENYRIFIRSVSSGRDTGIAVWLRRHVSWFVIASTGCGIKEAVSKRGQALQGKRASPRFETTGTGPPRQTGQSPFRNAGCTKHICRVSQGPVARPSIAARHRHGCSSDRSAVLCHVQGSSSRPRNSTGRGWACGMNNS